MHTFDDAGPTLPTNGSGRPWYKQLTRYHWFVLLVAALGWLFDCLDQQLFILARPAAMNELVTSADLDEDELAKVRRENPADSEAAVARYRQQELDASRKRAGDIATSIFIAGWACGGLIFGMLGDRIGRAKTMMLTILIYSLFTGLSSFSVSPWDFAFYRFLTGLGVGGEFAVGVALVAEVMPATARPYTLGLLQALSAIGNISAAMINLGLGLAAEEGLVSSPWRYMFLIGAAPALLALVIRRYLKEPEQWQRARSEGAGSKQLGSYRELFSTPLLRKHALLGLVLGCSGIIGLWSVGFYTPDLVRKVQVPAVRQQVLEEFNAQHLAAALTDPGQVDALSAEDKELKDRVEKTIQGRLTRWQSYVSIGINVGAFLGMFGFGALSQRIGRKPTFVIAFIAAFVSTVTVFWTLDTLVEIAVMVPIMGFCQLSLFAGYAIYFPELFPTRLRSTGTSFCYNVGRFVAAGGPLVKVALDSIYRGSADADRLTGMTMSCVFLVGLFVLPFLPETKDKPLPE